MRRGARLVAATLAATASWMGLRAVSAAEDPIRTARNHMLTGNRAAARAVLDSLLIARAGSQEVLTEAAYLRALLEENAEDLERRLKVLLRTGGAGRGGGIHLLLGRIAFARGDLPAALQSFAAAREAGRVEEGALWEGLTASALGEAGSARTLLERAARSGNSRIRQRAMLALGDLHRRGGRPGRALDWYRRVREEPIGSWWATAALQEARVLEELGRREEALGVLEDLVVLAPSAYEAPLAREQLAAWEADVAEVPLPPADRDSLAAPGSPVPGDSAGTVPDSLRARFTIQVGAFSDRRNAEAFQRALAGRGLPAPRVVATPEGWFRVLVGRYPTRAAAEALGDTLAAMLDGGFRVVPVEDAP